VISSSVLTLAVFSLTIALIVARVFEESLAALLGATLTLVLGLVPFKDAFATYIDWNIVLILLGMWIIAYYLVEAGLPQYLVDSASRYVSSFRGLVTVLALIAGFISTVVDNVLVVLLLVPVVIEVARKLNINPTRSALLVALSANFMGTALLLGDLPPQMLHSVAGAEFVDFVYMLNRPSSFVILSISFIATTLLVSKLLLRGGDIGVSREGRGRVNPGLLKLSLLFFSIAIAGMSLRRELHTLMVENVPWIVKGFDLKLGMITILTALALIITSDALRRRNVVEAPSFTNVVSNVEWGALLFYISLFILVGSLKHQGIIAQLASSLKGALASGDTWFGCSVLYWFTAPLVGFIEHDAYILTMLYTIKELFTLGYLANPWPYYWSLVWAGTLGSNLTVAGAPAIFVAVVLLRGKGYTVTPKEILSVTVPYTLVSLITTYMLAYPIWFL